MPIGFKMKSNTIVSIYPSKMAFAKMVKLAKS